jgi:tRNA pseudouridine38-40 synthase
MPTYRLLIEYDGTGFVGWQRQPEGISIQGLLEGALASICGLDRVTVMGSGRTDAGVHALGQVASFMAPVMREGHQLRRGLNSKLPAQVCCLEASRAPDGFDARLHARSKRYRYRILDGDRRSGLRQRFVLHERGRLDVGAMAVAAGALVGSHDFSSFRAAGSDVPTSIRTLHELRVERVEDEVRLEVAGSGFLRHMVRIMTGTLIEVGRGRLAPDAVAEVLAARDRAAAHKTAAACGLCLVSVDYAGADLCSADDSYS